MHKFFNGAIVAWSGILSSIPRGWVLCDGDNGTQDLRDKFIKGTANGIDPGDTGGGNSHFHPGSAGVHPHDTESGVGVATGAGVGIAGDLVNVTITTDSATPEPEFFEVAYIQEWEGW